MSPALRAAGLAAALLVGAGIAAGGLTGCGGAAAGSAGGAERPGAGAAACARDEVRLGASCWSAAGTRWRVQADGPGGDYRFELALLAAGRARVSDHVGASPAHDEWFQDGETLRVFLADRFVEYRARVTNGTVLVGEARNVRGQRWAWRAEREFGERPCQGADARTEEGCLTVEGTRWRLAPADGEATIIYFLDEGRLAVGAAETPSGAWEQAGNALTFTLAEGGPEHIALIATSRELSGRVGEQGGFSARRLDNIPPVMHP